MKRLSDFLFVRHRHNWLMLVRFGLVGGSGVLVNMLIVIAVKKIFGLEAIGIHPEDSVAPIAFTDFSVRWYHVFSTIAFAVANLWNFQLNRLWTFRSGRHAKWFAEYFPFLAVGLVAQAVGLGVQTLLMNRTSPLALDRVIFDESSGLRNPYYWAVLISIMITVPLSFVINKVWTFRSVRGVQASFADADAEDAEVATEVSEPVETAADGRP